MSRDELATRALQLIARLDDEVMKWFFVLTKMSALKSDLVWFALIAYLMSWPHSHSVLLLCRSDLYLLLFSDSQILHSSLSSPILLSKFGYQNDRLTSRFRASRLDLMLFASAWLSG